MLSDRCYDELRNVLRMMGESDNEGECNGGSPNIIRRLEVQGKLHQHVPTPDKLIQLRDAYREGDPEITPHPP